jgi:NADPH:quinone reductase-like Zn-dependent oxidoreductase
MLALVASPTAPEHVELREVPEPDPRSDEALITVAAISINRGELNRLATADDGWRPGWDVAGTVVRQAADGSGPQTGERVVGLSNFGGWCQTLAIPGRQLAVVPEGVRLETAAALPVAGLTALRILRFGGLLLDRRVLVTGGAGGVGRFAIQLGAQAGARVTAIVGSPERADGLRDLGAAEVVVGIDAAEGKFDLILEAAGGSSLATALKLVADDGTVVTFGNSSREATTFLVQDFYFSMARVVGFFLIGDMLRNPVARDLGDLLALVAAGRLDAGVALEAEWQDASQALRELRERRLPGKAILRVSGG